MYISPRIPKFKGAMEHLFIIFEMRIILSEKNNEGGL